MNKKVKLIIGWTIIAIIIQNAIFLYMDKVYLTSDIKIKSGNIIKKSEKDEKNISIDFPEGAKDVSSTWDGKYIGYKVDGQLNVKSLDDNKEQNVNLDEAFKKDSNSKGTKREIVYYKWLEHDTSMIIMQKITQKGNTYFEPIAYNAKKNEVRELADFKFKKLQIPINSKNDKVDDVVCSNATHSLYIKINKGGNKVDIYYANVMNELKKVKSNAIIGDIAVTTTNTNLITEESNKVKILNKNNEIKIPNEKKLNILGTDGNDNLFIGAVNDGKINKIFYGEINDKQNSFKEKPLSSPVEKQNIIIDNEGKVFINDKSKNQVLDLDENKTYKYTGDLVGVYNKGIIVISNGKLTRNKF